MIQAQFDEHTLMVTLTAIRDLLDRLERRMSVSNHNPALNTQYANATRAFDELSKRYIDLPVNI